MHLDVGETLQRRTEQMKKIWKIRKDSEAVSPVIATILMVAITVVLAAVLYVMVMGFGGPSQQTPTGSFSTSQKLTANIEKVQFGVITPDTKPADVKIVITKNTVAWQSGVLPSGLTNVTLNYVGGSAAKLASGDYLSIAIGYVGTGVDTFSVTMVYVPTGNIIGAALSFTW